MEQILARCGDDLTRANVMKVATNLSNVVTDVTDPESSGASTSPTDYRISKEFRMMRFDGERWRRFGPTMVDNMATD